MYITFHPIALKMLAGAQRLKQRRLALREADSRRGRVSKKRAAAEAPEQNGKKRSKRAPKKNDSPVRPQVLCWIRIRQSSCIFLALPCMLSSLTCLTATSSEQAKARSRRMHVLLLKVRERRCRLCADCVCACRARASV